jgi:hypothetical protein
VLAVVLQNGITSSDPAALAGAFGHTFWWVVAISVLALLPTVLLALIERRSPEPRTEELVPVTA